jgi:hypothetical protein
MLEAWAHMKDLAKNMHGLKHELLKWAANDLCKLIKVAKEGFLASWTITSFI